MFIRSEPPRRPNVGHPLQYGRPPKGETSRGVAVIVLVAAGFLIAAIMIVVAVLNPPAATRNGAAAPSATGAPGAEPSEEELRQTAQTAFDAYASGDSGAFWDLWTTESQALITREEYVRLFQLCPQTVSGVSFTITDTTITGETALVTATRAGDPTAYDYDFAYENGSWRYIVPPQEAQAYQTKNVDQIVQERRAAGACGTPGGTPGATAPPSAPPTGPGTGAPSVGPDPAPSADPPPG
ncbi:hypothetical protein [Planobispora takensis]|uniref:hypothetical protein n=1 Tax=Planobispora takensis TaxID=1367882 RepID=UPI0019453FAE|nr:hypothetical protein [Planobispora takensis]